MTEMVRKGAGDSAVVRWAHRLGLCTLGLIGVIACGGWLWQFALASQYWRSPNLTLAPAYLETKGYFTLDSVLILLAVIALLTAWFWLYPRSIRFALFALSSFAFSFELFTKDSVSDAHFWDVVALLLAAALILGSLCVIRLRDYWHGTSSMQRTLAFSLFLAVVANMLLIVSASVEGEGASPYELEAALIISLAIWPLLSRTKLGWLLVLVLLAAELIAFVTVDRSPHDSMLVALLPALIIILLLAPPVLRWYFPRKDAPKEAEEPG